MKNFVQEGCTITVTSPIAAKSGDLVMVGQIRGVANSDAEVGQDLELSVEGVYELKKIPADTLAPGDAAKVDANGVVAIAGATTIGWVLQSSGPGHTTARVRLIPAA